MEYVNPWDFILVPVLLAIIFVRARRRQERDLPGNPAYRYYVKAIMAKVFGGLALAAVYAFYYGGGDTVNYWSDASILTSLLFHNPTCYLDIILGDLSRENFFCFHYSTTGLPLYYLKDPQSFTVARLVSPLYLLTIHAFFACTVLTSWVAFGGVWRLYLVFCEEYPRLTKEFAISILFIPSVLFWGSGILKDTFTFSAVCWMTYAIYNLVIKGVDRRNSIIYLIISAWMLITIKPYIFVALLPGSLVWIFFQRIRDIANPIIKVLIAPIMLMVLGIGASFFFAQASESLGAYGSVDTMLEKAVVTQQDLKREAYGGRSFDIGDFEPTLPGVLSKAPIAIFSGLFRPTLLEADSPFMFITAIENTLVMLFFLYMFLRVGPISYLRGTLADPMSMFGFVFALFFSFAVGLTTSNFGSLARYKIPALPFFLTSIYIARERNLRLDYKDAELDFPPEDRPASDH